MDESKQSAQRHKVHSKEFKVHILIAHVADFCDQYGSLGPYSCQAGESVHSDFKRTIANYFVYEETDPKLFAEGLLKAIKKYNSKHLQNSYM